MKSEFVCLLGCLAGAEWNWINKNSGWQVLGTCRNTCTTRPSQDSAGSWKGKFKVGLDILWLQKTAQCAIVNSSFVSTVNIIHVLSSFALVIQQGTRAITKDCLTIWILSADFNCLPGNTFDHSPALNSKEGLLPDTSCCFLPATRVTHHFCSMFMAVHSHCTEMCVHKSSLVLLSSHLCSF